jgi:hypothetical protein
MAALGLDDVIEAAAAEKLADPEAGAGADDADHALPRAAAAPARTDG